MALVATHAARLAVLLVELPGSAPAPAGVLLEDPETDRIYVRMRRDWDLLAPGDAEILAELEADLTAKAHEMGGAKLIAWMTETLSNTIQVRELVEVIVDDFERALGRLYRQHVDSRPRPFVTHLPRYSLAVAAGKFMENQEVTEEAWEEAPLQLRLTKDMFVARIVGRSMEPRIPDNSLCVFLAGQVTGSREGRLVLVEYLGGGLNDRYTIKRYHIEKKHNSDGSWSHESIRLEPLNPEFEAWTLEPEEDRIRIIAEFVEVLA